MAVHYVYQDPDKTRLFQGDILRKDKSLIAHFEKYHPYYAGHDDYKYFMVLTQSCDLTRRNQANPSSPYITLAAVRPVEEVLRREAAKNQPNWQREAGVVGAKDWNKLSMFLQSLIDNNKNGYFYLHTDVGLGIHQNCVAFLQLAVTLKVEHYNLCLNAKIAQLKEPFQAKLGYLIGHMYSRIGTTEWNDHYDNKNRVEKVAAKLLSSELTQIDDQQIKEGIADLQRNGPLDEQNPSDIKDYIINNKIQPRKQKFYRRALELLTEDRKIISQILGQILSPLNSDLNSSINTLLEEANISEENHPGLRDRLVENFTTRLKHHLSDENMPDKKKVLEKMLERVLQDPLIKNIMQ